MTFPIIQLIGSSFQQGVVQGQQLQECIGQNLEIYFAIGTPQPTNAMKPMLEQGLHSEAVDRR